MHAQVFFYCQLFTIMVFFLMSNMPGPSPCLYGWGHLGLTRLGFDYINVNFICLTLILITFCLNIDAQHLEAGEMCVLIDKYM